jgi:hypothetical protein
MTTFAILFRLEPGLNALAANDLGLAVYGLDDAGAVHRLTTGGWTKSDMPRETYTVLIGWSASHLDELEAMRQRLIDGGGLPPSPIIIEEAPSWQALMSGAARGFAPFLAAQSGLLSEMARDLAALRIEHERLQESFQDLEAYVLARRDSPLVEGFVNAPVQAFPAPGGHGWRAEQFLPVSSRTLGAFALHIHSPGSGSLSLHLILRAPELARDLAQWRIPVRELAPGWITFGLPTTLAGPERSLVLELAVDGDPGDFRLSCGPDSALPDYRLKSPHAEGGFTLALRTFVAPPGLRLKHADDTILPVSEPA